MKRFKKVLVLLLVFVMMFSILSCGKKGEEEGNVDPTSGLTIEEIFKNGSTEFKFLAVLDDGSKHLFEVYTDKETVGDALLETGLISGEDSQYGLYVKTVMGITLDYDKDGKYWAYYIGDDMAMETVSATKVSEGALYAFKAE